MFGDIKYKLPNAIHFFNLNPFQLKHMSRTILDPGKRNEWHHTLLELRLAEEETI